MKQPLPEAPDRPAPIEYEPELIEESVRWAIEHGHPDLHRARLLRLRLRHRRQLDHIYGMADGEQRERAFRDHFWALFCELGFDRRLPEWLAHFPELRDELECILARSPAGHFEEGAELWESRERRGERIPSYLVVTIAPESFNDPEHLGERMLRQLRTCAELLDPSSAARRVDASRDAQTQQLGRATTMAPPGAPANGGPGGSLPCPLCRFPTTDWASLETLLEVAPEVGVDSPNWSPAEGCCSHCAERYELLVASEEAGVRG